MSLDRKSEMRAELIAQMVCAGIEKVQITKDLCITRKRLEFLMATPEYQAIELRISDASKRKMQELADQRLQQRLALRTEVEDAVDKAIRVLLKKLNESDGKEQLRAALEILDRDPRHDFTKASRQTEKGNSPPPISPEALSNAVKEAGVTHNIIEASQKLQ